MIYVGLAANVLELTPSLLISEEEIGSAVSMIGQAIEDVDAGRVSDETVAPYMMW